VVTDANVTSQAFMMQFRTLLIIATGAALLGAHSPATAASYLFSSGSEQPAQKSTKKAKVDPKAKAKADAAAKKARTKADAQAKEAKAKATKTAQAKAKADAKAKEDARQAELNRLASHKVAKTGNNGELRSEKKVKGLFGSTTVKTVVSAETRALDAVMEQSGSSKKFKVKPQFEPKVVRFSGYQKGTIVIDTKSRALYLIESSSTARRYAIAVGKQGLQQKGTFTVGDKQEWPRWIPTKEMQEREPAKYGIYKDGMPGGPGNPLGARAIYLYDGGSDTYLRIHGTNQPETIGTSSSNGCYRMINAHVQELYKRVRMGTKVVVI
jgi:lipoprotein-anchoring transpeptidase ErfK/SrfK